ncbi:MAG: bacterial Ig-like domain-containing protein [Paludibacteraceae bacterium]|nr:bacterial Ig-like domain-containing protein [Paludibacteraceae bacterium]
MILIVSPAGSVKSSGVTYNYGAKAMTATASGSRLGCAEVTISSNSITSTTAEEWTLSGSSGSWKLNSGNKYLYATDKNQLSTTTTAANGLVFGLTIDGDNKAWFTVTVNNNACKLQMNASYSGGVQTYFALYTSNQKPIYIYKKASSCAAPTAPNNSSITSRGATLSTSSSSADYQFFCSTSSSPASKTADYTVSGGQSVTISNLKYGTTYYYWARHDCGSSSYSNWVAGSPTSFTTSCPNSLSVSAGTLTTSGATFTITDSNTPTYISFNGSGYGYEIYYSTSSDTPGSSPSGTVTTTSTSKSVTGLSAGQEYYYWVRGYGPNGKSSWVSGGNFTTLDLSSIAITTDPTKLAYIHGETFDKTGAVVTATYTNSTTANVSSSAVWTPSTALTTTGSNTITATYTENGTEKTATIDVTVYGVTMQALDDGGNTIPATGPDAPTRSVATITPKADKGQYVWKEWSVSGATLGSSKETKSNSINTPTADITVTAVYWAPRNVVWMVNGAAYTIGTPTSTIAYYKEWKDLKLPTDPTPPCGDKFMGWTTTNIGSTGLDVDDDAAAITALDLMTSDNKSEKTGATGHYITDATVTFYAVFADYGEDGD